VDPTQGLRDYHNFIAEVWTIEEIIGSLYNKLGKWGMYLVQWVDDPDYEDWIEKPFEHMTMTLDMLGESHK
jgi:hypothetical protein